MSSQAASRPKAASQNEQDILNTSFTVHKTTSLFVLSHYLQLLPLTNPNNQHPIKQVKRRYSIDCDVAFKSERSHNDKSYLAWSGNREKAAQRWKSKYWTSEWLPHISLSTTSGKATSDILQRPTISTPKIRKDLKHHLEPYSNNPVPYGKPGQKKVLETGDATLYQIDYSTIASGWFADDVLNIGFDLLSRILRCDAHKISILNSIYTENLHRAASDFANKVNKYKHYRELKEVLQDRDFVIVPINDGLTANTNEVEKQQRKNKAVTEGSHWTILIIDCHGPRLKTQFLNSISRNAQRDEHYRLAKLLAQGVKDILVSQGERVDLPDDHHYETETPQQSSSIDNASAKSDSGAACGPFVWAMAKEYAQYIVNCKNNGIAVELALPEKFSAEFKFDSLKTRMLISRLIDRERKMRYVVLEGIYPEGEGRWDWFNYQIWLRERGLPRTYTGFK